MEKINYHNQEPNSVDRLIGLLEAISTSSPPSKPVSRVTEPATREQLGLLANLGIFPKWLATRQEAEEMICNYKLILRSAGRKYRL